MTQQLITMTITITIKIPVPPTPPAPAGAKAPEPVFLFRDIKYILSRRLEYRRPSCILSRMTMVSLL